MANYDFSSLSPYDFEELTRDLLQKELSITLESFKNGKDEGIDLRYSDAEDETIVQCKHYCSSTISNLISNLKNKEFKKISKLNPNRYILVTSLPLSPKNKEAIIEILKPYCNSTHDIIGKEDLNNYLGKFQEIEKKHFKLWLNSTALLEKILHSNIATQTEIEIGLIKKKLKIYVQNKSFFEASKILEEINYCLIVGIPGIGKTTLAEILLFDHLDKGYEIIKIANDIDEAYQVYNPNAKQLFYYDDFLGQTSLEDKFSKNEEQKFLRFIEWVKESKTTKFIMTTREYILNQAKDIYENLSRSTFDTKKCVIDIEKYTKMNKAKILFNHIYFSSMEKDYRQNLINEKAYMKIINHPNFNPRLIEWMVDFSKDVSADSNTFIDNFIDNLNHPMRLWGHAFENQISNYSRELLISMTLLPSEILLEDLQISFSSYYEYKSKTYNFPTAPQDFYRAIRELDGNFITTNKIGSNTIVRFNNPSIKDFMETYICSNSVLLKELCIVSEFFDQYVRMLEISQKQSLKKQCEKIFHEIHRFIMEGINKTFHSSDLRLINVKYSDNQMIKQRWPMPSEQRIVHIYQFVRLNADHFSIDILKNCIQNYLRSLKEGGFHKDSLLLLIDEISKNEFNIGMPFAEIAMETKDALLKNIENIEDFEAVHRFKEKFGDFLTEAEMQSIASRFQEYNLESDDEWRETDPDSMQYYAEQLKVIGDSFGVNVSEKVYEIKEHAEEEAKNLPNYDDGYDKWDDSDDDDSDTSDNEIEAMFDVFSEDN